MQAEDGAADQARLLWSLRGKGLCRCDAAFEVLGDGRADDIALKFDSNNAESATRAGVVRS